MPTKLTKPTDNEILGAMRYHGERRCVTYVLRNIMGRERCSTAWVRSQLRRLEAGGLVKQSAVQDRNGMVNWDITDAGRLALSDSKENDRG